MSSDSEKRANKTYDVWDIANLLMGFGFPMDKVREFGLNISKGIKNGKPEDFSEPDLLIFRPDSTTYSVSL